MRLWRMNLGLKTIRTIENVFEITISTVCKSDTDYSVWISKNYFVKRMSPTYWTMNILDNISD